jgi:succinyl-CoA synthetase alpha subunit
MSILVNKNSKIVVQGITGSEGEFHTKQMIEYGTNIIAGVTPGKGGQSVIDESIKVYNSVEESVAATNADTSIIFVPPPFAADAIIEAAKQNIDTIVCISEGIPIRDMIKAKEIVDHYNINLIGPNCPGIITVDVISSVI